MNSATFAGRVGRDAELRYSAAGKPILTFALAVDDYADGEKATLWIDCAMFGDRAEKLAPHLTKGSSVAVRGKAHARAWAPREGGEPKAAQCCAVFDLTLLGGARAESSGPRQGAGAPRAASTPRQAAAGTATDDSFHDDEIPF